MAEITHVEGNLYQFKPATDVQAKDQPPAKSLFEQGLEADNAGEHDKAIELYNQAMAQNAESADSQYSLNNVGAILTKRRDYKAAEEVFRKLVAACPHYPLGLFNLACTLGEKWPPQRTEAVEYYISALAIKPNYGDAYYNLGYEYSYLGEVRLAIHHYGQYLHYSGNEPYWRGYAEREIRRLSERELQLVAKPAATQSQARADQETRGAKRSAHGRRNDQRQEP
jgi:tetratricopeptide (TPR) repeat protein